MNGWLPLKTTPSQPMMVLFYLGNVKWRDTSGNEVSLPAGRDDRFLVGFWDGEWRWAGTGHEVFELHTDNDFIPTHWRALPAAPSTQSEPVEKVA